MDEKVNLKLKRLFFMTRARRTKRMMVLTETTVDVDNWVKFAGLGEVRTRTMENALLLTTGMLTEVTAEESNTTGRCYHLRVRDHGLSWRPVLDL